MPSMKFQHRIGAIIVLSLVLGATAQAEDETVTQTPSESVGEMNALLAKGDFKSFYEMHCLKHVHDQMSEKQFVDYMKNDSGAAVIKLFSQVDKAIREKAGEDILIARPQEKADEYEFILVEVKKRRSKIGEQWHLELKKVDGRWKLLDTD